MELERDLVLHYESTIRAIESGRIELARRRLGAYSIFAETFLEAAAHYGVHFPESEARSASLFDWPIPIQIGTYAQKAVEAAIRSQNTELMSDAAYTPIRFLRLSVQNKEFLFYLHMLRMYPRILALAYESSLESMRERIIEHSWRPLQSFCQFVLLPETKDYSRKLTARYASHLLWTYSDLLKVAMDHGDPDTFGLLGVKLNHLITTIRRTEIGASTPLSKVINSEPRLIWFGLATWVVRSRALSGTRMRPGQSDQRLVDLSLVGQFMEVIGVKFSAIRELSDTYFQALTQQYDLTRWESWIWQTQQEGFVQAIDYEQWLTRYYALEGLRLVIGGARDNPSPHYRLRFSVESIESFLREVEQDPQKWVDFIPGLQTQPLPEDQGMSIQQAIEQFLSANSSSVQDWEQAREDRVISASLDTARINAFKREVNLGWQTQNWFEELLSKHAHVRREAAEHSDDRYVHLRFLAPKDMFIGDSHSGSFGVGQSYGSQLADGVTSHLLSELESRCEGVKSTETSDILPAVMSCIPLLESSVVILFGNLDLEQQFTECQDFLPYWAEETPISSVNAYLGRLGHTPVFIRYQEAPNKVLLASLSNSGTLVRHVPLESNFEGLKISITCFERKDADLLIAEKLVVLPENLRDSDGKPTDTEEAIRWLLQQVKVFVGAKVEWEESGSTRGFVIPIAGTDGS